MITVSLCGKEIVVRPKHLLDYVEKLDYIKSRRVQPYDLLRTWEVDKKTTDKGAAETKMLIELAMVTVYTRSSSVSIEEEMCFDGSWEGFYYNAWRCTRLLPCVESEVTGVSRLQKLWDGSSPEEQIAFRLALNATDEGNNLKNSDGPSDSTQ